MMKFVAMAAMVAAAPSEDDWKVDLDMLKGGEEFEELFFPRGTKVTVTAIENRSWGYEWAVTNECEGNFKLIDDAFGYEHNVDSEQVMLGRKGRRTMTFETPEFDANTVAGIESCTMTFSNKRPWLLEADSPDMVKKMKITVGELLMGGQQ